MIPQEQLGLFWGQGAFYFVVTKEGHPVTTATISFDTPLDTDQDQDIPDELKFTALLKKAIREQGLTAPKIKLALPTKDLMFRSFVIPWMNPEEITKVVEFEIIKYIPIPLVNLIYTYHPVNFTKNGQKKLRILFVAIRKETLEKYTSILKNAGLEAEHIEPSAVSLVRVLEKQKHIGASLVCAILEISHGGGKIIVVDHNMVQFVRELQIPPNQDDPSLLTAKLSNDIRISLNFYTRQGQQQKSIDKIILLSLAPLDELQEDISSEFGVPVKTILAENIFKANRVVDLELLNAYGVALKEKGFSSKDFALSQKTKKLQKERLTLNYKFMAGVIAVCVLMITSTSILTNKMISGLKKKRAELQSQEGIFQDSDTAHVQTMKKTVAEKLASYKSIRVKSNIAFYLTKIPQLLPPGTWLSSLRIHYNDTTSQKGASEEKKFKTVLDFEGYAYLENPNDQFRLVNKFVEQLKNEEDFANSFTDIDLVTLRRDNLENYPVTYFKIACK